LRRSAIPNSVRVVAVVCAVCAARIGALAAGAETDPESGRLAADLLRAVRAAEPPLARTEEIVAVLERVCLREPAVRHRPAEACAVCGQRVRAVFGNEELAICASCAAEIAL